MFESLTMTFWFKYSDQFFMFENGDSFFWKHDDDSNNINDDEVELVEEIECLQCLFLWAVLFLLISTLA